MSKIVTNKRINLGQLATEMGGAALSAQVADSTTTVTADIADQATLDAAVNAHVAIDEEGNAQSIRDKAATALTTNGDFLALANPTNAQIAAQVKALTRQNNGLIRLALGKFDATD